MRATQLVEKQHRKVEALFNALETGKATAATIDDLAISLAAHAVMEEELFYPAVRQLKPDLILESLEEHELMAFALKRLVAARIDDEAFRAKVTTLKETVMHHVEEEEKEILPAAAEHLGENEDAALGKQMDARFKELVEGGYEAALAAHKARRSADGHGHRKTTGKKKTSQPPRREA